MSQAGNLMVWVVDQLQQAWFLHLSPGPSKPQGHRQQSWACILDTCHWHQMAVTLLGRRTATHVPEPIEQGSCRTKDTKSRARQAYFPMLPPPGRGKVRWITLGKESFHTRERKFNCETTQPSP